MIFIGLQVHTIYPEGGREQVPPLGTLESIDTRYTPDTS